MWDSLVFGYYYHTNVLGNTGELTNTSNGSISYFGEGGASQGQGAVFTHDHTQLITWT